MARRLKEVFTVIGIDDEKWSSWSRVVTAFDEYAAMKAAAIVERKKTGCGEQIVVVGAVLGNHMLMTPSDENNRLVSSVDLA